MAYSKFHYLIYIVNRIFFWKKEILAQEIRDYNSSNNKWHLNSYTDCFSINLLI